MSYQLINKYKPKDLEDINLDKYSKNIINMYMKNNKYNFIIQGNICSGKSSLINILINKYYNINSNNINNNLNNNPDILYINLLKDYGINYYRNEIKNFCNINNFTNNNKKKTIVIDDIDQINDNCQQIIISLINKYNNINFLFSFFDYNKINENFLNILELIYIKPISVDFIKKILKNIIIKEQLNISDNIIEKIIKLSNYCIPESINNLNKIILFNNIDNNIDNNINVENILSNITIDYFNKYINYCKTKNFKNSFNHILKFVDSGYSVIDIIEDFFLYIKNYSDLEDKYKFEIIKVICSMINVINNINEENIELLFMTNNIIDILN
jgi:DNA polymerase III delta prime subunit